MLPWILANVNWTQVSDNWMDWVFTGYYKIIGEAYFYPLVFFGIVGYIYALSQSATAAAVGISLIFGIFGVTGVFSNAPEFVEISYIIVVMSFAAAFTAIYTGRKR